MIPFSDAVIDANLNRVSEGLRVIEEYTRFILQDKLVTQRLSGLRKRISHSFKSSSLLFIRDIEKDMRAKELPVERLTLLDLLTANFKRVSEGLRVLEEYTSNSLYNDCRYDVYSLEKEICLPLHVPSINPGVYFISDDANRLEAAMKMGVSLVQLRDKSSSKDAYYQKAKDVLILAKRYKVPFIVNDYLDIALLLDADGFHSGQDDISVEQLRQLWGPHKLLGRTTHSLEQGQLAEKEGASYVSIGPIWETPSKPGRQAIGFDYLKAASGVLSIPYVAIGGISRFTIKKVMDYSPPLVGLVRALDDIPDMMKTYY